jgi:peptidoglycan/LPS O-acetylase OafA/YrhL
MNGKESNYMRQLDGLRALCVAAVAWSHWGPLFGFDTKSFPGADIGVEAFFVISGFLITGILLDNRSDELRPQVLKQFYIRRFLRIFPVFYVALGLVFLLNVDGARPVWIWHAGYLSNLWFYMHGWGGALSHFWSLAVEEQFYLFWPVFIFMVPRKYLLSAVMLVILIAPVYALFMNVAHPGVGRVTSSVLMPSCLGALGMGALLAHLARESSSPKNFLRWLLGLGIAGVAAWYAGGAPDWLKPFARLALDGVLGWLVFAVARGFGGPVGSFLQCAPMSYLGRISYGIYIVHNFILSLVVGTLTAVGMPGWWTWLHETPAVGIPLFIALTVGLASLSWHLYEKPLNNLKRHFPYPSAKPN